ncbi:Hypothetical Protein FCC1311_003672 [Hondaea fermentalgiana]|uniref:Uncharacterized protein n=1 Tax=Hondaea fermentalgiana TaxID=2315210 RepID=A0A2R5G1H4_9STRA|nr:Hypothetical Protein FCC1311_003672 [Hondaea fermentalgiana]|eukprot:GBG24149.1 Hypothetical Protein FCC1311_003672 [Hondaea fermentalgiana]
MSDFWSRTKSGLADARDASKRTAQRTKLKAEIELLRRKQTKLKHEFGVEVFAFWDDQVKRDAVYASYKAKIDELAKSVQSKQAEIDQLGGAQESSSAQEGTAQTPPPPATGSAAPSLDEI